MSASGRTIFFADSPPAPPAKDADDKAGEAEEDKPKKTVEWGILGLPNSLALIAYHVAFDNMETTLFQLAPTSARPFSAVKSLSLSLQRALRTDRLACPQCSFRNSG